MELVRIRVVDGLPNDRHMWCERWWTRVWVMTPREHYPPNVWQRLMGHHALEIESTEDGVNWKRIWPLAKPDPEPAPAPTPKAQPAPVTKAAPPKPKPAPKPKTETVVVICDKCNEALSDSLVKAGRKRHTRCPGKKKRVRY